MGGSGESVRVKAGKAVWSQAEDLDFIVIGNREPRML